MVTWKFQVNRRIEEIQRKAAVDWLNDTVHFAIREPEFRRESLDWLSEDENALLTELILTFILLLD